MFHHTCLNKRCHFQETYLNFQHTVDNLSIMLRSQHENDKVSSYKIEK